MAESFQYPFLGFLVIDLLSLSFVLVVRIRRGSERVWSIYS